MESFTSTRVLPCLVKAAAFHVHEQSHLKWLFQIKQVKSEQGWGRLEFRTRCLLLTYSLGKQARAASRNPDAFGRRPVPYAAHQHRVKRNEQAEWGGHRGLSDWCLTSSRAQQPPSTQSHLLHISIHRTKGDPILSSNMVIPKTSITWLSTEWGMEVQFFPSVA